jgi:hypothetical protein
MKSYVVAALLAAGLGYNLLAVTPRVANWRLPGNHQDYEPVQPIAYSHRLHAGEMRIPCLYCHFGAEKSRHAGIPPVSVCMNCHRSVIAPLGRVRAEDEAAKAENRRPRRVAREEIAKLYAALGLDATLAPAAGARPSPVQWVQVHRVPDFVYFDHRPHVAAGVACQTCHGPIETMERVRQTTSLSMGWCVNCHRSVNETGVGGRKVNASIDCTTCHY